MKVGDLVRANRQAWSVHKMGQGLSGFGLVIKTRTSRAFSDFFYVLWSDMRIILIRDKDLEVVCESR